MLEEPRKIRNAVTLYGSVAKVARLAVEWQCDTDLHCKRVFSAWSDRALQSALCACTGLWQ